MTKEKFDRFKNKILELSGDAEVFWEEFKALQTTKEKAIHLLREKNFLLKVRSEELRKAKDEVKNFKSHLQEALTKIKRLEDGNSHSPHPSQLNREEGPANIVDLSKIANEFDEKLAKRKEKETLYYLRN
jgi:hypothetical protein